MTVYQPAPSSPGSPARPTVWFCVVETTNTIVNPLVINIWDPVADRNTTVTTETTIVLEPTTATVPCDDGQIFSTVTGIVATSTSLSTGFPTLSSLSGHNVDSPEIVTVEVTATVTDWTVTTVTLPGPPPSGFSSEIAPPVTQTPPPAGTGDTPGSPGPSSTALSLLPASQAPSSSLTQIAISTHTPPDTTLVVIEPTGNSSTSTTSAGQNPSPSKSSPSASPTSAAAYTGIWTTTLTISGVVTSTYTLAAGNTTGIALPSGVVSTITATVAVSTLTTATSAPESFSHSTSGSTVESLTPEPLAESTGHWTTTLVISGVVTSTYTLAAGDNFEAADYILHHDHSFFQHGVVITVAESANKELPDVESTIRYSCTSPTIASSSSSSSSAAAAARHHYSLASISDTDHQSPSASASKSSVTSTSTSASSASSTKHGANRDADSRPHGIHAISDNFN
ncbi:hypothetical protein Micbo1qcDRAFT_208792 [Microdochium bolleyi]|uniref:Uncharacterized protein n=1 Tax=Microdochium bolleyi TaxID=196109 RepID=A0A136IP12_9PEZI|nr:hypothetical protein Micbo1qcDRAFT_208792 [Microdochium bolleyi]